MSNLSAVVVLFGFSLAAAFVLFKFLQSTAAIQKKEYQVGGAAAGFVIIYLTAYGSYANLQKVSLDTCQASVTSDEAKLAADEHELPIQGVVQPPVKDAQIFLAVQQFPVDEGGRFRLTGRGVNPTRDSLTLHVIAGTEHILYNIFPVDDTSNIVIPSIVQNPGDNKQAARPNGGGN